MARKPKDQIDTLELKEITPGLWQLSGTVEGLRIRKQSPDELKLKTLKAKIEGEALAKRMAGGALHPLRASWISEQDLTDTESALNELRGSGLSLREAVRYALDHIGGVKPITPEAALKAYREKQRQRKMPEETIEAYRCRLEAFFEAHPVAHLGDVTGKMIDDFVLRAGLRAKYQQGEGGKLLNFFRFCSDKKQGFLRSSPFAVDMKEILHRIEIEKEDPQILTPEQVRALLNGALAYKQAKYAPHIVLAVFCMARAKEIARVTIDDLALDQEQPEIRFRGRKRGTAANRWTVIPKNILPLIREMKDRGLFSKEPLGMLKSGALARVRREGGLIELVRDPKSPTNYLVRGGTWEQSIMRHTGISYLYRQTKGEIGYVTAQAGNSPGVAYDAYVRLIKPGDEAKFYAITAHLPKPGGPAPAPLVEFKAAAA